MTIDTISTLPTAPARTDAPATFISRADAFLAALVTMQGELNTSIGQMNTDIGGIAANVTAAQAAQTAAETAETNAEAAQAAAEAASSATLWVSGTSYSAGDVVYSPVDYKSYRANTATSGTTDPSASADWTKLSYALPTQTGNSGKYLTTDGTNESWAEGYSLPTQTGNSGKYLTTDGTNESWGTVEAGATQFGDDPLTYSTYKLVGYEPTDAFELDSDRELVICGDTATPSQLSCVVYNKTTSTWGTEASISSSDIYLGAIKIDTDKVLIAYSDESSTLAFRVLTFSGTSVTVNTEYTSTISAIYGQSIYYRYGYGLFDCGTSYVVTYPSASSSANQIAVVATVSGTTVTIGSENTIQASAYNIYTVSPASGYVAFATNDGTNFKVLSYSISGTTLTSINSGTYASTLTNYYEYAYIGKTSGNHYLFKQNQSTDMDLVVATFDGSYNVTVTGYAGFLGDDFNYGDTTAAIFDASNNAIVCTSDGATYINIYNGNTTSVGTSISVYTSNWAYATDDAIYVNSNAMRKKFSFNSGSLLEEAMNKFNVTLGAISSRSMSNGVVTNNPYALYNASSLHISNTQYMYSYRTASTNGLANTINRSDDSVVFTPMDKASYFGISIAGVTDARYGYAYDTATTNYYIQRVSL